MQILSSPFVRMEPTHSSCQNGTYTSLMELPIGGVSDIVFFSDEKCLLATTLVSIHISRLNNLRSLSWGICNLTSL